MIEYFPLLLSGFLMTIAVSTISAIVSFLIGIAVAIIRINPLHGLRVVGTVYVEFFRNTPLLVQAFAVYFGLPKIGIILDPFQAGVTALSLYSGAYAAEAVRSGFLSIPKTQIEASRALGLTFLQSMRFVILPQALRIALPPLGNLTIALVKNSSILSSVGLAELVYQGEVINSLTFRTFEVFTAVIVCYLILTLPLGWFVSFLTRRRPV